MADDSETGIRALPQAFYDLIVYYSSFLVLLTASLFGLADPAQISRILKEFSALHWLGLLVVLLSLGYTWGQLSSALSHFVIKRPIAAWLKVHPTRDAADFFFSYEAAVAYLYPEVIPKKKAGDYWTPIFYLSILNPSIGNDLLKRYARCKLARVNAFNALLLFAISVSLTVGGSIADVVALDVKKATLFLLGSGGCAVAFAFEFYKRQCWFGDIVLKALWGSEAGLRARRLD